MANIGRATLLVAILALALIAVTLPGASVAHPGRGEPAVAMADHAADAGIGRLGMGPPCVFRVPSVVSHAWPHRCCGAACAGLGLPPGAAIPAPSWRCLETPAPDASAPVEAVVPRRFRPPIA